VDRPISCEERAIALQIQTFARWVSTPENLSARLAVAQVADRVCSGQPHRECNPLLLHGRNGTGKTHLVSALAHEVALRRPEATVQVLASRELTIQNDGPGNWHPDSEIDPDLLAIEDLQLLPARAAEALVTLLDDRLGQRQQTVLTTTAGPAQLTHLPVRLTSRLAGGLVVGLTPFGRASRLAFLQDRIGRRQLPVGRDVLAWLAENLSGSGRQLEGAVARLETLARLGNRVPDLATVAKEFRADAEASQPSAERIAERVGQHFQADPRLLRSRRRSRGALLPRQVAMALARQLTGLSLEQIGAYFGGRDHSTVLHACRKVESGRDAVLSGALRQLQSEFA